MRKLIYGILIVIVAGIVIYVFVGNKSVEVDREYNTPPEVEYVTYKTKDYGPEFSYPESWGDVVVKAGNKVCPEEDTYRTSDSLHVYDSEISFPEKKLPGSDSIIRTGIRQYKLDPKKLNDCGDDFHNRIARRLVDPRTISSFKLDPVTTKTGLSGTYNGEASRLNTESRIQYTFFLPQALHINVIQAYVSFIPYFNSPELKELEGTFGGDMYRYIREGKTAEYIRVHIEEFKKMVEGMTVAEAFEGEADPSRMSLGMQTWTWINTTYGDGKEIKPHTGKKFTLTFKNDGTFGAATDCNGIGGNYIVKGDKVTLSNMISTEMYCEGSQESEYAKMLGGIDTYHFTSRGELIFDLKFDSGSFIFR